MKTKLKLFLISCFLILSSSVFAQNHWTAEPASTDLNSMRFSIRVFIDGVQQDRTGLEVAAFCEGYVRAVGTTVKVGPVYRASLTILHDRPDDMTRFKMYDPETGIEYISTYEIPFDDGGSYGSNTSPIAINFIQSPYDPTTIYGYAENMTVGSYLSIDGEEQLRTDLQMAVYSGEELRGFGTPVLNSAGTLALCNVLIWGNSNGEPLTYHLYDPVLGEEYLFDGQILDPNVNYQDRDLLPMTFTIDGVYGNWEKLVVNFKRNIVTYVAQIGVIKYITLAEAIDAAMSGQTIQVINNISQTEAVEFPAGMNLTLDLNGYDVEIAEGGSIMVSGNLTLVDNAGNASFTSTVDNFIINEGAQLYHTMPGILATAKRNIAQTTEGWDGIASPMTSNSVLNIETNGINELYYYDETGGADGLEWRAMTENADNQFQLMEAGRGYLYANSLDPNQPQYESSFFFDFEDGTLNGWTTIDADGDGECWYNDIINGGEGTLYSNTNTGTEDYIVTSEKYTLNEDFVLSFDWELSAARRTSEYLTVVFSTDNVNFGVIYDLTVTAANSTVTNNGTESLDLQSIAEFVSGYEEDYADINDYVGQNVYIGFLHNNSNGSYASLDNIRLTSGTKSARADEGAVLNFAGTLNNADVTYKLSYTESQLLKGFNLLGNPFAHEINIANIYNDNLAEGYYVVNNRGEWLARTTESVDVVAPMEAFLVQTNQSGDITIRKNARSKRNASNGALKISVGNASSEDVAFVSFNDGFGLDKISHHNETSPMLYVSASGKNYAVATMDKDFKEIPVSFEAKTMGQYTISVESLGCEFEELYLKDKQTGDIVDLNAEDYTFLARTGDAAERFVITMSMSGTNSTVDEEHFIYVSNGELVIEKVEGEGYVRIYDVLGRPVAEYRALESARISTAEFRSGIYLVQMSDDKGVKLQKILID